MAPQSPARRVKRPTKSARPALEDRPSGPLCLGTRGGMLPLARPVTTVTDLPLSFVFDKATINDPVRPPRKYGSACLLGLAWLLSARRQLTEWASRFTTAVTRIDGRVSWWWWSAREERRKKSKKIKTALRKSNGGPVLPGSDGEADRALFPHPVESLPPPRAPEQP